MTCSLNSTTKASADLERLTEERRFLDRDRLRLEALLARLETGTNLPAIEDLPVSVQTRIEKEFRALDSQRLAVLDELSRIHAERQTVEKRIEQIDATLPLIGERAQALKKLAKQSLAPRAQMLELEEERVEQEGAREVFIAQLGVSDAAAANLKQRLATLLAQTEAQWRDDLAGVETRLASYAQEIRKAASRVGEYRLTASVDGTVQQLSINTVGGVVTPAEKLMLIVPNEGALHIEAWIPNKDVGFVSEGQAAEIKIETFPFTKYGTIDGEIKTVSTDAVANEELGLVYLAQVSMAETTMWVRDKLVNLTPGMAVTVVNGGAKLVHPGGAKLVHLTLCGTQCWEVPVDPPGQP